MTPQDFGLARAQYSFNETLSLLSIGRSSLYALVHSGELVPIKFGCKTLFAAPDIVKVIEARRGANLPMMYKAPGTAAQGAEAGSDSARRRGRPRKSLPAVNCATEAA
jgi:hypothetical protein